MITPLARQQQQFAACVLQATQSGAPAVKTTPSVTARGALSSEGSLRIYQNNYRETLVNSLASTYPLCEQLIGVERFRLLGAAYVGAHPSQDPTLNYYGAELAGFMEAFDRLAECPYLPDMARFEWASYQASLAEDAPLLNQVALNAVSEKDRAALVFVVRPGSQLLSLEYPVTEIAAWCAVDSDMSLVVKATQLYGLVWRNANRNVEFTSLPKPAWQLLTQLSEGVPLGMLCEQFSETTLSSWLPTCVANSWIVDFVVS